MIKNKTAPHIFRLLYLIIGFVGILASLGLFDGTWREDFYLPFTHLSNYACIAIMFVRLRAIGKEQQGYLPLLSFIGLTAILLTFTVFHLLLAPAPNRDPSLNYRHASIILHVILPLMYVTDWIVFDKHGHIKWYYPLISALSPLAYVIFVYTRAAMYSFDSANVRLYLYFFLDLDTRGVTTITLWMIAILIGYLVMGYGLLVLDRALKYFCNNHNHQ